MHIAYWSPFWPLAKSHNGIVTYVHWMKIELERMGHKVTVFTGDNPGVEGDVEVVRSPGRLGRAVRRFFPQTYPQDIARKILEVHRRTPIDVIEMEESFGWFADVARLTGIPLLVKLHGPAFLSLIDEELAAGQQRVADEGASLRQMKFIAAPCLKTLQQTIERYGITLRRGLHIRNPLVADHNTPLWKRAVPDTILFVGRFDRRKGADVALEAFRLLLKTRPAAKLVFVGPDRGILVDGEVCGFNRYVQMKMPEIAGSIDYRGTLDNSSIAQLRTQAAVTVVASRWENPGYTLLEAMFQGCPVVTSDAGGGPETVPDGTGLFARSEDPEDFAAKILQLLDNPQQAADMGKAARERIVTHHSAFKIAVRSLDVYREVIEARLPWRRDPGFYDPCRLGISTPVIQKPFS